MAHPTTSAERAALEKCLRHLQTTSYHPDKTKLFEIIEGVLAAPSPASTEVQELAPCPECGGRGYVDSWTMDGEYNPSVCGTCEDRAAPSPAEVPAEPVALTDEQIMEIAEGWGLHHAPSTAKCYAREILAAASPSVPQAVPQAAIDAAVAAERERCASLIEPKNEPSDWTELAQYAAYLAKRIRSDA